MKTKELLRTVSAAVGGLRTNDRDRQNMLFRDGHLYSWSAAISISAELPEDAKGLKGIVNGADLVAFLSKLNKENIDISCDDDVWTFTSQDMEAELNTREDDILSEKVEAEVNIRHNWKDLPSNFYECLSLCDIPNNMDAKSGVFMKDTLMVATDNRRVNRATLKGSIAGSVLMSTYSVAEIRRLGIRFTQYSITDRGVHFRALTDNGNEHLVFSCSRLDDSCYRYNIYSGFVDKAREGALATGVLPDITQVLSVTQCFDDFLDKGTERMSNIITLTFKEKYVVVSAERSSSGRYSEKFRYPDGGSLAITSPISVRLTSTFLAEAIRHSRDFSICRVDDKHTVLLFAGPFFDSVIQVLM